MIAMAIAPSLFQPAHAVKALQFGIRDLYSDPHQLGVKTLSPSDPHYRCFYDNSMSFQGDLEVCGGWSYHNVRIGIQVHERDLSGCGRLG